MGRVFVLKSVRVWFKKDLECRYISHLDLNRTMLRALHKSKIPIWHTEGFNPHPFATFPLPLSLGFRGENECMDVKLEEDDYSFEEIKQKLNACLPRGLRVFDVTEPVMKAGKIAYASFTIRISSDSANASKISECLKNLLSQEKIEVEKKSKKGLKLVDVKPGINKYEVTEFFEYVKLDVVLSAGSSENVNPNLIVNVLQSKMDKELFIDITRNKLYNSDLEIFR